MMQLPLTSCYEDFARIEARIAVNRENAAEAYLARDGKCINRLNDELFELETVWGALTGIDPAKGL